VQTPNISRSRRYQISKIALHEVKGYFGSLKKVRSIKSFSDIQHFLFQHIAYPSTGNVGQSTTNSFHMVVIGQYRCIMNIIQMSRLIACYFFVKSSHVIIFIIRIKKLNRSLPWHATW
jgi:hypothetical protein